jgi:hypothetical protein
MKRHIRSSAPAGSSPASRPAIRPRSWSRSRTKVGRWRQDTLPRLVSSDVSRLSTSTARCSKPCSAASSILSRRFSSGRDSAAAARISASRSAPKAARFSGVTFFRLAAVGRFTTPP